MNIQELAQEVLKQFQTKTRDEGQSFVSLKDDHPEWMQDLCREAHGDMLPDDNRYEMIQEALQAIADSDEDADLSDVMHEIEADFRNADLLAWVSSSLSRAGYVNEAVEQGYADVSNFDLFRTLQAGQIMEKNEVFASIQNSLEERLSDLE